MKIQTTRWIDLYAGVVACFLLTMLRRAVALVAGAQRPLPPIRRILFIKLAEQGATVLAHSAIKRATELVGRENVFFLVFEKNRAILDIMNVIPESNVLVIRDSSFSRFVGDAIKALWRTRQLEIDTTIDMELFARISAILAFLSGAKRRTGLHRFTNEGLYRGDLLTHRVQYNPHHHIAIHYDVLLTAAQRDSFETPLAKYAPNLSQPQLPQYEPSDRDRARIITLLRDAGVDWPAARLIVFNPKFDDVMPIRRWPSERYVALAKRVLAEFDDATIIISGLPAERDDAEQMRLAIEPGRVANLAGMLALRDLITLLDVAQVLVTSDSGPAHFAALTGVEIVVLFGSETPSLYGPLGNHAHPISAGLACSPCLSAANHRLSFCKDNQCMKNITVEEVLDVVKGCLEARQAADVAESQSDARAK